MTILAATISVGKSPLVLSTLELFFDNLWVETHFFKEAVNHLFPTVSFAVVSMTVAMTVTIAMPVTLTAT